MRHGFFILKFKGFFTDFKQTTQNPAQQFRAFDHYHSHSHPYPSSMIATGKAANHQSDPQQNDYRLGWQHKAGQQTHTKGYKIPLFAASATLSHTATSNRPIPGLLSRYVDSQKKCQSFARYISKVPVLKDTQKESSTASLLMQRELLGESVISVTS